MGKFFINLIAGIDVFIHWGISELLRLIFIIADVNIFRAPEIEKFTNKVYGLLGVIILFKIVISAIQYLINPDKLVDKKEGIGGLLQRTIISVALLALVPTIFDFAKELQVYVSKTIPGIILGADAGNTVDDIGKNLSFDVLKVFVNPKKGKEDKVKESNKIENMSDFSKNVTAGCGGALWDGTDDCIYDYNFIFSIGVGLFMVYVLLSMGIDIGIRSIKMGLLQLLAPIPISSYINSEENFKTWYKTAFKVYADLFIRLIVIYFIIYIINSLKQGISKGTADELIRITEEPLLYIYIIVALLLFAKQAPKFICDILGIKSDGEGIGDMFKPAWSRAGGFAAFGGMATAGAANVANRLSGWNKMSAGQRLKAAVGAITSGVAGAASAGFHGGLAAIQGKNGKEVMAAGHKRAITARQNRDLDRMNGVNAWNRTTARAQDFLGLDTAASLAEGRQKAYSTIHTDVGNFKKAVMGRITKTANVAMVEGKGSASAMLGDLLARNMGAILASGNTDLISYTQKFNMHQDGNGIWHSDGLKDGVHLSYHDLAAITDDAAKEGIGSISSLTKEDGALTLQAQKELFAASMSGNIVDINGKELEQLNVGNEHTHVDIATAVGIAQQHIRENAVSLGKITDGARYTDENGNVIDADDKHPIEGAAMFINALEADFGKLDDALQRKSAELSNEMSGSKDAAARASNQRRDSNKKSGS